MGFRDGGYKQPRVAFAMIHSFKDTGDVAHEIGRAHRIP
jgi:hypothetical protein